MIGAIYLLLLAGASDEPQEPEPPKTGGGGGMYRRRIEFADIEDSAVGAHNNTAIAAVVALVINEAI